MRPRRIESREYRPLETPEQLLEAYAGEAIPGDFDEFTSCEEAAVLSDHPANDTVNSMFFFFCPPHKLGITFDRNGRGNLHTHAVS